MVGGLDSRQQHLVPCHQKWTSNAELNPILEREKKIHVLEKRYTLWKHTLNKNDAYVRSCLGRVWLVKRKILRHCSTFVCLW